MFEPAEGGASLGANPTGRVAKSQDLNTALIFWFFFIKEKNSTARFHDRPQNGFFNKISQILMRLPWVSDPDDAQNNLVV